MKQMKKLAAFMVILSLVFAYAPTGNVATKAANKTYKGFEYEVNKDDTVTIVSYSGKGYTITIPNEIDGKTVTTIGKKAFEQNKNIRRLVLSNGLKTIDDYAFTGCSALTAVHTNDGLERIGKYAFLECSRLNGIELPDGLKIIDEGAFVSCRELSGNVKFPSELTELGEGAYARTDIKSANFNQCAKLKRIPCRAFDSCKSLKSVGLFSTDDEEDFDDPLPSIGQEEGVNYDMSEDSFTCGIESIGADAFRSCFQLEYVVIGKNVTNIEPDAFKMVDSINTLMCNVKEIGPNAFSSTAITDCIFGKNVESIRKYAFSSTYLGTVTLSSSVKDFDGDCLLSKGKTEDSHIGGIKLDKDNPNFACEPIELETSSEDGDANEEQGSAEESGSNEEGDANEESGSNEEGDANEGQEPTDDDPYEYEDSFTDVGVLYNADKTKAIFGFFDNEQKVEVADTVTEIGAFFAQGLEGVEEIVFPENLKSIGECAFATGVSVELDEDDNLVGYSDYMKIKIPASVTDIGKYAFAGLGILQTVSFEEGCPVEVIKEGTFYSCKNLETVELSDAVTTIEKDAFDESEMLRDLQIPENVKTVTADAFDADYSYQFNVAAGNKNFKAVNGVLYSKDGKTLIAYPDGDLSDDVEIGDEETEESGETGNEGEGVEDGDGDEGDDGEYVEEPEGITYVMDESVEHVADYAFTYNDNISEIVLSPSLKTIGKHAFGMTEHLDHMVIPESVTSIGYKAIGYGDTTFGSGPCLERLTEGYYIIGKKGSEAQRYAKEHEIAFATDTPSVNTEELTLKGNETGTFKVENLDSTNLYYFTSNETVATIDQNGVVTGHKKGETYVIAAVGMTYFVCKVTVTSDGTAVKQKFNYDDYEIVSNGDRVKWEKDYLAANEGVPITARDLSSIQEYSGVDVYEPLKASYFPEDHPFSVRVRGNRGGNLAIYHAIGEVVSDEISYFTLHKNSVLYSGIGSEIMDCYTGAGSKLGDMVGAIGRTGKYPSCISTTLDKNVAATFQSGPDGAIVEFYMAKGSKYGAYISCISSFSHELEMMLNDGFEFEVLDAGVRMDKKVDDEGNVEEKPCRYMKVCLVEKEEATTTTEKVADATTAASATTAATATTKSEATTEAPVVAQDNKTAVVASDGNKVTTTAKGEATLTDVKQSNKKSVSISAKAKVDGYDYKVTTIAANAFKNLKKATTVTLPNTVVNIKSKAFAKSKVKTVKITVKKGAKLNVSKNAFKNSKVKKIQLTLSKADKKNKNKYIKLFTKAGIKKSNIKVKYK